MAKSTIDYHIQDTNRRIGEKVRTQRVSLGITRAQIAPQLGISQQQFEKYEKGTNRISAGMLKAIADALDLPLSYFYEDSTGQTKDLREQMLCSELSKHFLSIKNIQLKELIMITSRTLASIENKGPSND